MHGYNYVQTLNMKGHTVSLVRMCWVPRCQNKQRHHSMDGQACERNKGKLAYSENINGDGFLI